MALRLRPPWVALLLLAIAFAIDALVPTAPWVPERLRPLGFVPIALGAALGIWALRTFHRHGTTHDPFGTPAALVVSGPFRYSRNPMYVAVTLILLGIAWGMRTVSWWFVPALFFLFVRLVQVPHEERLLDRLFGDAYRAYRARVRRWV
jgi:protein-S-isoprenylcysteine O-methyltransferase Ste14